MSHQDPGELWLQIAANPTDDNLKEQFVDSLPPGDERAQPMRICAAIAENYWNYDLRQKLLKDYLESLNFYKEQFKELESAVNCKVDYHEGWPCMLTIDASAFVQGAHYIFTGVPIRHVDLTNVNKAPKVFQTMQLARVASLGLGSQKLSRQALESLLSGPYFTSLRWLNLGNTGITDDDIDSLAASSTFRKVEYINLQANPGSDPVDLVNGYGCDGITGSIVPESVYLPPKGVELEKKYGRISWLNIAQKFSGSRPERFDF